MELRERVYFIQIRKFSVSQRQLKFEHAKCQKIFSFNEKNIFVLKHLHLYVTITLVFQFLE